jgi:hypothetical protein
MRTARARTDLIRIIRYIVTQTRQATTAEVDKTPAPKPCVTLEDPMSVSIDATDGWKHTLRKRTLLHADGSRHLCLGGR